MQWQSRIHIETRWNTLNYSTEPSPLDSQTLSNQPTCKRQSRQPSPPHSNLHHSSPVSTSIPTPLLHRKLPHRWSHTDNQKNKIKKIPSHITSGEPRRDEIPANPRTPQLLRVLVSTHCSCSLPAPSTPHATTHRPTNRGFTPARSYQDSNQRQLAHQTTRLRPYASFLLSLPLLPASVPPANNPLPSMVPTRWVFYPPPKWFPLSW